MKKLLKLLFSRLAFVALFMLLQIVVIVATLFYFQGAYTAVQTVSVALALVTVSYTHLDVYKRQILFFAM